jgi:heme oxygenase
MVDTVLEFKSQGVLESLRGATRSRHASLSASPAMVRLFDSAYTVSEYRSHLGRLLGFFDPLERAIGKVIDFTDPVHSVQRSLALREDLLLMGMNAKDIEALKRCRELPHISPAGVPGYSYVVLGSMLGGKIIVKRLSAVLGSGASFRFFGEGNDRFEALWASFCADLEDNRKHDVQAICDTAVEIFDAYAAWLSDPLPQPGVC